MTHGTSRAPNRLYECAITKSVSLLCFLFDASYALWGVMNDDDTKTWNICLFGVRLGLSWLVTAGSLESMLDYAVGILCRY